MKKLIISTLIFITAINFSFGADDYGTTTGTFLKFGIGARAAAMGNAALTNTFEPSAIFWNPAQLFFIDKYNVQLTHNQGFMGNTQNFLGANLPLDFGNVGIAINHLSSGEMARTIATGSGYEKTGNFSNSDLALMASYSKGFGDNLSFGVTAKYISQTLSNTSGSALALDLGLFTKFDMINLGFAVRNLGTSIKFKSEEYPLPFQLQAGGSITLDDFQGSIIFGTLGESKVSLGIGGEYKLMKILSLRCGYQTGYGEIEGSFKGLSGGLGINYEGIQLDYAFTPFAELGNSHHLSLAYTWGATRRIKQEVREEEPEPEVKVTRKEPEPVKKPETVDKTATKELKLYEKGKCYGVHYASYPKKAEAENAKSILIDNGIKDAVVILKVDENTNIAWFQLISGCYDKSNDAVNFIKENPWVMKELNLTKKPVVIK